MGEPEVTLPKTLPELAERFARVAKAEQKYQPLVERLTLEDLLGLTNVVSREITKRNAKVKAVLRAHGIATEPPDPGSRPGR